VLSVLKFGYVGSLKERELSQKLSKALFETELGKLMVKAYKWEDSSALHKVIERNLWFVSEFGMREFVAWKKALKKAKEKNIEFSIVKKARDLI
jgi:hypothetical protein